jgi:hypothetical protein
MATKRAVGTTQTSRSTEQDQCIGAALDNLLAALGEVADACGDVPPQEVASRVLKDVYLDDASLRAIGWARRFLAALEAGS